MQQVFDKYINYLGAGRNVQPRLVKSPSGCFWQDAII